MNCPACDAQNRPGAQSCKRCAAPMPLSCFGCGVAIAAGEDLCPACRTERVPSAIGAEDLFPTPPSDQTAVTAAPYELRTRFVGRERALDQLRKAFEDTVELGELSFAAVIGPPGAGKSRLTRELARTIKQRWPEARFLSGSAGGPSTLPHAGFVRILSQRFGITTADSVESSQEKIIAGVGEVLPASKVTEIAHLLAHLMRVGFPQSPIVEPLGHAPSQLETRTFIAVKRFLAADAEKGPLVLCFDDLERAGAETINLLHYLAAGLMSSPIMLLCVARPSLGDAHPSFGEGEVPLERVDLGPLDQYEVENLMRELLRHVDRFPESIVEHAKKLGGLPRTLLELVRLLLEAEVIHRSGATTWSFDQARLARLELPTEHPEILARRLDTMPAADRDLLEKASVCGEVFWLDAVVALQRAAALSVTDPDGPSLGDIAAAGDRTRLSTAQTLAKLVEREWIVDQTESSIPGEREYRFAYPPLWDVVYAGLDEASRRRYHRRVAQWLELRPEGRGEEAQEEVARHLERAGDGDAAAARYRRAGDAARRAYFNEKAIRLYAQALACTTSARSTSSRATSRRRSARSSACSA
jgi:predicted ATPase